MTTYTIEYTTSTTLTPFCQNFTTDTPSELGWVVATIALDLARRDAGNIRVVAKAPNGEVVATFTAP